MNTSDDESTVTRPSQAQTELFDYSAARETRPATTNRAVLVLFCLTLLAMLAQVMPFILFPAPDAQALTAASLPAHYPPGYTAADYAKAHALDQAIFWGSLIDLLTAVLALLALLRSGISERVGAITAPKARAWLTRVLFLTALFLCFRFIELPFRYCRFQQYKALGLSMLTVPAWLNLLALGLIIPLTLFVLKYIMVTCTLPLCKRWWWIASALGLFFISEVLPEIVSRTYPLDTVENVRTLEKGAHFDAMKAMLHKGGLDLPIMVVDESRRSKSANICFTGRAGREYVLLTDTFVDQYTPKQVSLAMAHELGHFQHKSSTMVVDKSCALLLFLLSFGLVFLLSGRKALPVDAAPRIILLTLLCSMLVSRAFAPVSLELSRAEERYADRYALQLAGDASEFGELLLKVAQHEIEPLDMPSWQYYLSASHPTFLERIAQAERR